MSSQQSSLNQKGFWPHAPLHQLSENGTYFVTAATYKKEHIFRGSERLAFLHNALLIVAHEIGWRLEAWAVFSNHYHFVAHSPEESGSAASLVEFIRLLHGRTARWVNAKDNLDQRSVWHNYWEVRLTFEKSYYARLSYTHQNPVKHGLVRVPSQYPWCSAQWFERSARAAQVRSVYSIKTDRIKVVDDFDPAPEW